jgi:hypothetical protein
MGHDDFFELPGSWNGSASQRDDGDSAALNGHAHSEQTNDGMLRPALSDVDDEAGETTPGSGGRWVTRGGVLRWEPDDDSDDGGDAPLREDARSSWADDNVSLPLGAPPAARLRAMRAWLARRRMSEMDLVGALLLERRRLTDATRDKDDDAPERPDDPLALALTEAQSAADEYETLLDLLNETRAHVGPPSALVEFYLGVTERLAALAAQPAAEEGFAERVLFAEIERQPSREPVTPAAHSDWEGRSAAVLATRQHIERISAAEPEDD